MKIVYYILCRETEYFIPLVWVLLYIFAYLKKQDVYLFIRVGHETERYEEKCDSLRENSSSPIKVLRDAQLLSISSC